jgi:mannose-6-phosphate isomerase-like protein (cupin superfamily)
MAFAPRDRHSRPRIHSNVATAEIVEMRSSSVRFGRGFRVILGNARGQAAQMTIAPGDSEGGPDNNHRGADQWLFVVAGRGVAIGRSRRVALARGTLMLVEKGNLHEIRNLGTTPLKTLNFYTPPAYDAAGDERPAGKPKKTRKR